MCSSRTQQGFSLVELLVVIAVIAIGAAMAAPSIRDTIMGAQLREEGNALTSLIAFSKVRATSKFSRARVRVDIAANTYRLEVWDKTHETWTVEGAVESLPDGVTFGFAAVDEPPPDTQVAIGFAAACTNDDGDDIGDTSCITFNSRGIPIDAIGSPLGGNAFYMTDGMGVRATTVSTTPLVRQWWSPSQATAWSLQ